MNFLPVYIYFVTASFIASLSVFFIHKNKFPFLKYFTPFLFLTLMAETYGSYLSFIHKTNVWLYNFFSIFEFGFYFFIISLFIRNARMQKIIRISIVIYITSAVINILFIQGMKTFHTITYSLGCLLIVTFCIYYFLELFQLPKS